MCVPKGLHLEKVEKGLGFLKAKGDLSGAYMHCFEKTYHWLKLLSYFTILLTICNWLYSLGKKSTLLQATDVCPECLLAFTNTKFNVLPRTVSFREDDLHRPSFLRGPSPCSLLSLSMLTLFCLQLQVLGYVSCA